MKKVVEQAAHPFVWRFGNKELAIDLHAGFDANANMTDSTTTACEGTPYGEFLAEQEEIQRLKWLVSEQEGRDIGFEFALNEWAVKHRAKWRGMRNRTAVGEG